MKKNDETLEKKIESAVEDVKELTPEELEKAAGGGIFDDFPRVGDYDYDEEIKNRT